jgi:hypothetical protein
MNKKRGKKSRPRLKKSSSRPALAQKGNVKVVSAARGFDFGVPMTGMLVSGLDFPSHLHDSRPLGVAYGYAPSHEVNHQIPILSLIVRNPEPAAAAFREFQQWGADSDGDVVELALILEADQKYTFAISQEMRRLLDRMTRFDRAMSPLFMSPVWMLPMPITGSHVRDFCDWRIGPVRPFFLTAAVATSPQDLRAARPIDGLRPILKFECSITLPGEPAASPAATMVRHRSQNSGNRDMPRRRFGSPSNGSLEPTQLLLQRSRILSIYFPVTMERLALHWLEASVSKVLEMNGLARWQIEQAICNLVLSRHIVNGAPHYEKLRVSGKFERHIAEALGSYVEELDGHHDALHALTSEEILIQVALDGHFLLTRIGGQDAPSDLRDVQEALSSRGLLNE